MKNNQNDILLTIPSLLDQGGVSNYFNSILSFLGNRNCQVRTLEIGRTKGDKNRYYYITDQLRFRKAIATKPELVHINPSLNIKSFIRDGLFVKQAKGKGLKVLVFFRGWQKDFEQVVAKRLLWFFKRTFGQADAFIVLASEFKYVLQQWGVTQPIFLGTTTVDEALIDDFSIENKVMQIRQSNEIKILFLSRLEREKGVFETVDAICELVAKKLPVILSIAGDGSVMDELRRYINEKKLPENTIHLLGYVKGAAKKAAFINNHIYCFPTYYGEGLPNSVLEAMAFGMPVITCPVGGIVDFFEEGKMGHLCNGKEPKELAQLLEKLLADREKLIEIGRYNHAYAKENFMASKVAAKLENIYIGMLQ